jgi:GNAT superfamily N-acetyltransferase
MVNGELAGAIRVQALSDVTGEFGMLAADPEHRGNGVGTVLVDFAEQHSRDRGMRTMQLEVLTPRTWRHPSKVFLDEWYRRIGYRVAHTTRVDETYPDLAPLLATPCQFVVYEKPL